MSRARSTYPRGSRGVIKKYLRAGLSSSTTFYYSLIFWLGMTVGVFCIMLTIDVCSTDFSLFFSSLARPEWCYTLELIILRLRLLFVSFFFFPFSFFFICLFWCHYPLVYRISMSHLYVQEIQHLDKDRSCKESSSFYHLNSCNRSKTSNTHTLQIINWSVDQTGESHPNSEFSTVLGIQYACACQMLLQVSVRETGLKNILSVVLIGFRTF